MMFRHVQILVFLFFVKVLISGCGTSPIYLDNEYDDFDSLDRYESVDRSADDENRRIFIDPKNCSVVIDKISDERIKKEHFGFLGNRPIHITNVMEWLESGVIALKDWGYDVYTLGQSPEKQTGQKVELIMKLKKAYMRSVTTSMSSVLVFEIEYLGEARDKEVRNYRGTYTTMNMAGAEAELRILFNRSFNKVLGQISDDMSKFCAP